MLNWLYFQIAMYYLRKAKSTPVNDLNKWTEYSIKSLQWIRKIQP